MLVAEAVDMVEVLQEPQVQVGLVAAEMALVGQVLLLQMLKMVQQIEAVVVGVEATHQVLLVQAVLASSSSNTSHLFNPYSHSKVLAIGLPLLA
jgi:hypothetical protein